MISSIKLLIRYSIYRLLGNSDGFGVKHSMGASLSSTSASGDVCAVCGEGISGFEYTTI